MSFLRNPPTSTQMTTPAMTGIPIQTSVYGKTIAVGYGTFRAGVNAIYYNDFVSMQKLNNPAAGSGKGGGGGGASGKTGGGANTTTVYQAALAFGVCEGPIVGFSGTVWQGKAITTLGALGFSGFAGTYPQTPWGYLTTAHPGDAYGYNGLAYIAAATYQLGESAQLPNHTIEVHGRLYDGALPNGDADASRIVSDILINPEYGVTNFPSGKIGDLSIYQSYVLAAGLLISPYYDTAQPAATVLTDLMTITNSEIVWNGSQLTIVPYGDEALSGNSHAYTPPASAIYDLTDDDFVTTSAGQDPVRIIPKDPIDIINSVKIEVLDRSNNYNVAALEAKDQAAIDAYGLNQASVRQQHAICNTAVGRYSVQLQLQRESIERVYEFTLDARYMLLDPMDIVSVTDTILGLNKQWVRIKEISENADGTFTYQAEEYAAGTGGSAIYSFQPGVPFVGDYGGDPGNINTPIIFEPDASLTSGPEVWFAVSGGANWGGCEVWASDDNTTFKFVGTVNGAARMGVLSGTLAGLTPTPGVQTIDITNTLHVDMSMSHGQLISASQGSARTYATLCYCGGEYLAFATAALTSADHYDLSYLVRGAFNSYPNAHAAAEQFCRIDQGLFKFPYTDDRIGQTLYFKFPSFNQYRGGLQSLASVSSVAHVLTGAGLQRLQVAFDQLSAELRTMIGFQANGAQIAADLAAFAHDRAIFADQDAVARIATESTTRQTADTSLAQILTTVQAGLASEISARSSVDQQTTASVTSLQGTVTALSGTVTQASAQINDPTTGNAALAQATNTLAAQVSTINGTISTQATQISQINANAAGLQNQVTQEATARTNFDGSMTGYWAVTMSQSALDNPSQRRVSGVRLISVTGVDSTQVSQFVFEVDKIFFAPVGGVATAVLIPGTVNGNAYFGLRGDMVIDGTISTQKVAARAIQADQIAVGALRAEHFSVGSVVAASLQADAAYYSRNASVTNIQNNFNNTPGQQFTLLSHVFTVANFPAGLQIFVSYSGQLAGSFQSDGVDIRLFVDGADQGLSIASLAVQTGQSGTFGFGGERITVRLPGNGNHTIEIRANVVGNPAAVGNPPRQLQTGSATLIVGEARNPIGTN